MPIPAPASSSRRPLSALPARAAAAALLGSTLLTATLATACHSAPAGAPTANTVCGRILGEDGKPIALAGVKYSVTVSGITSAGQPVGYTPAIGADGTWSTKLVAGNYHQPSATLKVPFGDKTFEYKLVPSAAPGDFDAANGEVCDFTWKIRGVKPNVDNPDPGNWTHYFGGQVGLLFDRYPADEKTTPDRLPKGTKLRLTATPTSKLIDGNEGKPITLERDYDDLFYQLKIANLNDLPVANYKISGTLVTPDGKETPLRLRQQQETTFHDTVEIIFAGYGGGNEPIGPNIWFAAPKP